MFCYTILFWNGEDYPDVNKNKILMLNRRFGVVLVEVWVMPGDLMNFFLSCETGVFPEENVLTVLINYEFSLRLKWAAVELRALVSL
jgi:hypothetical protein